MQGLSRVRGPRLWALLHVQQRGDLRVLPGGLPFRSIPAASLQSPLPMGVPCAGLKIMLIVNQSEYLPTTGGAGARVAVHRPGSTIPRPRRAEEGVIIWRGAAVPGRCCGERTRGLLHHHRHQIRIHYGDLGRQMEDGGGELKMNVSRKGPPYGNCSEAWEVEGETVAGQAHYYDTYSTRGPLHPILRNALGTTGDNEFEAVSAPASRMPYRGARRAAAGFEIMSFRVSSP